MAVVVRSHRSFVLSMLGFVVLCLAASGCDAKANPGIGTLGSSSDLPTTSTDATTCTTDQEGTTRACHVETGRHDGIINCFSGTQICASGQWGACGAGASGGSYTTHDAALFTSKLAEFEATQHRISGVHALATPPPSDTGPSCSSNVCNPYCWGVDAAPAATPTSTSTVTIIVGDYTALPTGWVNDNQVGCTATNLQDCFLGDTCCTKASNFKVAIPSINKPNDYNCVAWSSSTGQNKCKTAAQTNPAANAGKADFTLGIGCDASDGHVHFPVCNRGDTDATWNATMAATRRYLRFGLASSNDIHNDCSVVDRHSKGWCDIDLSVIPIAAGSCIDLDLTAPATGISCMKPQGSSFVAGNLPTTGNLSAYINELNKVPEVAGCNNWSASKHNSCTGSSSAGPLTVTEAITASCAAGYSPQWNQMSWDTTRPTGTNIKFEVQSAPSVSGAPGAYIPTPALVAGNPGVDTKPDDCSLSGPSPCPIDLATLLGSTNSLNPYLKLTFTLTPSATAGPTLNTFQVTYNCTPSTAGTD